MIRAVIFDMDGVLIDSEIVYIRHQVREFRKEYPWLREEDLYPLVGIDAKGEKAYLGKLFGRESDDPAFLAWLRQVYHSCQVSYPDILRPQVPALLDELRGMGLQVALASSSPMNNIRQVLSECGIADRFHVVVSGEQFHRSKPDPEIYQHTMGLLGRSPEECLVVEDSTYGVAAGVAAGATVAALRDDRFPFDQSPAQLHIESLDQLPALCACGGRQIRAVFFDVDGTLTDMKSHQPPRSALDALERLRSRGIKLLLNTGRHPLEMTEEHILTGVFFDGAAYLNGQLCLWEGEPVREGAIPPGDLAAARAFLTDRGRSCIFLERDRMYCNRVDRRMEEEQARIGTAVPPVEDISRLETRSVLQLIPFVDPREERELLARMPHCQSLRWGETVTDVTARSGGKEAGLAALCEAMGIPPEACMAFGDGENDAPMLAAAGIGVAMGDACPPAKAAADYVTDPVEQDGILHALERFRLI